MSCQELGLFAYHRHLYVVSSLVTLQRNLQETQVEKNTGNGNRTGNGLKVSLRFRDKRKEALSLQHYM